MNNVIYIANTSAIIYSYIILWSNKIQKKIKKMPNFASHIISLNYIVDKSPIVIIALRIVRELLNVWFMVFTPLSTIFQLYRGGSTTEWKVNFEWNVKPKQNPTVAATSQSNR